MGITGGQRVSRQILGRTAHTKVKVSVVSAVSYRDGVAAEVFPERHCTAGVWLALAITENRRTVDDFVLHCTPRCHGVGDVWTGGRTACRHMLDTLAEYNLGVDGRPNLLLEADHSLAGGDLNQTALIVLQVILAARHSWSCRRNV